MVQWMHYCIGRNISMDTMKMISQLAVGDRLEGCFLLQTAQGRTSSNGKPFLSAVIADRSGTIDAKVWDYPGPISSADEGQPVHLRGVVSEFRGALQLTIDRLRLVEPDEAVDLDRLVPVAPIDSHVEYRYIQDLVHSIEDPDYRAVAEKMLEKHGEALFQIPAAKSVHHSFVHGLLMHTGSMLRLADFLSDLYRGTVDRSLLLTGTLLHDLAKAREFSFSRLGLVTEYSVPGQLLGHLVMGAQDALDVAKEVGMPEEKSILLQHLILSHHGQPEFGAAVLPCCAESELLSLIDQMDSRMEIYAEAMEETPVGTFSKRIFALDNKKIFNHG